MTLRLPLGVLVVAQVLPPAVRQYWPAAGFASNLGTLTPTLPACWYVELNAGPVLVTIAGRQ